MRLMRLLKMKMEKNPQPVVNVATENPKRLEKPRKPENLERTEESPIVAVVNFILFPTFMGNNIGRSQTIRDKKCAYLSVPGIE